VIQSKQTPPRPPDIPLGYKRALDRFELIADPGFGDHAPISHQHHPRELEAMAQLFNLGSERLGIGRIPVMRMPFRPR
jgi:hypothetical protein